MERFADKSAENVLASLEVLRRLVPPRERSHDTEQEKGGKKPLDQ
jgi:hypothetical protein